MLEIADGETLNSCGITFCFYPTSSLLLSIFFFLNDTPPPKIYPLPLHDPLPISPGEGPIAVPQQHRHAVGVAPVGDRHIQLAIAIEVAYDRECRAGAHGEASWGLEGPNAVDQQ